MQSAQPRRKAALQESKALRTGARREARDMPDSNITKHALAAALRELMAELPFDKINVAQICERCDMNRKSFYYHFKDKYDLVNWIFDTEFIVLIKDETLSATYDEHWKWIRKACDYFQQNHVFYRKALQISGQNSFQDHFRQYIRPLLVGRLTHLFGPGRVDEFAIDFFTDAVICAMERWLLAKECMPAEEFVEKIKGLMEQGAASIYREMTHGAQSGV